MSRREAIRFVSIALISVLGLYVFGFGANAVLSMQVAWGVRVVLLVWVATLSGLIVAPAYLIARRRYRELVQYLGVLSAIVVFFITFAVLSKLADAIDPRIASLSNDPLFNIVMLAWAGFQLVGPFLLARWFVRKSLGLAERWWFPPQDVQEKLPS